MAASSVTLTASSSNAILAADGNRDFYLLQLQTQEPTYIAFGEAAANATGIVLRNIGDTVKVRGAKARLACNGYSAYTPTIGIETFEEIDFIPTGLLI